MQDHTYLTPSSLKHHLLIATPNMGDSYFTNTVIYICEHNIDGTMGLIINKPFKNLLFSDVLEQMSISKAENIDDKAIMQGGPVKKERGFILHKDMQSWESCLHIQDDIYLTTSRDIIAALAENKGPSAFIFTLGFSGWDPGQLESEIAANNWLVIPADSPLLFDQPHQSIRSQAAKTLNIDIDLLGRAHGRA